MRYKGRINFKCHYFYNIFAAFELDDLKRFSSGEPPTDAHTVTYKCHPVVLLNALEVLGYRVVSSFNSGENSTWTMRKVILLFYNIIKFFKLFLGL